MFLILFLIWLLIGLVSFGMWFGFTDKSFSDFDFKIFMVAIVFTMVGPINIIFAISRLLGIIGSAIANDLH